MEESDSFFILFDISMSRYSNMFNEHYVFIFQILDPLFDF